jgi:hypothetical protein
MDPGLWVPVAAWSLTTALGVVLFGAFVLRPRRREHAALEFDSAGSAGGLAASVATASPARPDAANGVNLPQWLPAPREPLLFAAAPKRGVERRTIGYRLVRMSAAPDDIRSREVGRLDRGDEVDVIDEHEGFLKVRTPTGLEGWVPRIVIIG